MNTPDQASVREAVQRATEIAYRDEAKSVSIRAADLRTILAALSASEEQVGRMREAVTAALAEGWGIDTQRFIVNGNTLRDEHGNDRFFAVTSAEAAWERCRERIGAALKGAA